MLLNSPGRLANLLFVSDPNLSAHHRPATWSSTWTIWAWPSPPPSPPRPCWPATLFHRSSNSSLCSRSTALALAETHRRHGGKLAGSVSRPAKRNSARLHHRSLRPHESTKPMPIRSELPFIKELADPLGLKPRWMTIQVCWIQFYYSWNMWILQTDLICYYIYPWSARATTCELCRYLNFVILCEKVHLIY